MTCSATKVPPRSCRGSMRIPIRVRAPEAGTGMHGRRELKTLRPSVGAGMYRRGSKILDRRRHPTAALGLSCRRNLSKSAATRVTLLLKSHTAKTTAATREDPTPAATRVTLQEPEPESASRRGPEARARRPATMLLQKAPLTEA